jgi:hypothetical protein
LAFGLFLTSTAQPGVGHAAAPPNTVIQWNADMLAAFATANVPPPAANRLGGIVQAAVFDAVNGIEGRYTPIHVAPDAAPDASPQAAAASASYTALVALFPAQKPALDSELAASLRAMDDDEDGQAVTNGMAWGASVADQILAWRSTDGFSAAPPPYVFSSDVGQFQPTPGGSGPPKFRTLATTVPFAMSSPSEFRPAGPPALTSARCAQDFDEVKSVGALNSATRTPDQTETATFWQLDTPVAMWDRVADQLLIENHRNLLQSARVLALTNISITDAIIAIFDAKNFYNTWRPVTAIVGANLDGNAATAPDASWLPLMTTPYFQEYPSAHSGTSSAAAATLASFFGANATFTVTSAGLPGVERTFTSFRDAVAQVEDARVYAGFHFRFSCEDANAVGAHVSEAVLTRLIRPAGD